MENEMIEDGLYCDGGSKWMSIGSEGNVYICNTFIYQNEYSIGNLFTDDIILGSKFRRCPIQSCDQICDRHWSKKRVYKDGVIIDQGTPKNLINKHEKNYILIYQMHVMNLLQRNGLVHFPDF